MKEENILVGAHTSIAGGLHHALEAGVAIGATTVQIFTANQRQWHPKVVTEEAAQRFKEVQAETGLQSIMSHASYLINLGSPRAEGLHKSREAFQKEVARCRMLGLTFLNFHPGAALDAPREQCLERIVASLLGVRDLLPDNQLQLVIEATAGQGSVIGASFEEIGYLVKHTAGKVPIGVCLDTCHIFAAGYDIRTEKGWEDTLKEFEEKVGLRFLSAFHLNDSMKPLGSRRDRHAPLGKGEIGRESFRYLMRNPKTAHLPKYLETPGGHATWKPEIQWLKEQVHL